MKRLLQALTATLAVVVISSLGLFAQSTNAGINGTITDQDGETLPGATVVAVHQPSGTTYGSVTREDGRFNLSNIRVGGPYKVEVSYVGFQKRELEGVYVSLGQNLRLDFDLAEEGVALGEVTVRAKNNDVLNADRTGAETRLDEEVINALPTIDRDLNDFIRATPQANTSGSGVSIGGVNNRYNAIFIDGAVNNDVFGLASSGTNGGQTGISPISLDAIEQIQVVVAPYDVRLGGFAGGGVNAVTRSGSNEVEGSVYLLTRNESLTGLTPTDDPDAQRDPVADFSSNIYGIRVGGPIIKDKAFFFVSGEIQREQTPQPFDFADYDGDSDLDKINQLVTKLRDEYGYDPGGFAENTRELRSDKLLFKFDWNINEDHKLTARHSYVKGESFGPSASNPRNLNFYNSGIYFPSVTNSSAIQLNSIFGTGSSNEFILGFTSVRDDRDPLGDPFPFVDIDDGPASISIGSEEFSTANVLDQDIFTITNNFQLFRGNHTITLGTHNEFYSIRNVFIRQNYGSYDYNSVDDFLNDSLANQYDRSYSLIPGDEGIGDDTEAAAEFNAMQLGFYAQDEIAVNDKLTITAGVRVDIPIFTSSPVENVSFNQETIPMLEEAGYDLKGARAGGMPSAQLMFAPRVGFNYALDEERNTQFRGGLGIFTSRVPFVWPGGAYNNNGLSVGGTRQFDVAFNPDYANQPTLSDFGGQDAIPSGQMDLFAEDFKFPQVFRANLAVDQQLPWGVIATLEGIYTKTLNNVFYENLNLRPSDTRLTGSPDDRILYDRRDPIDDRYTGIYLASNTNEGYAYNITAQLQKPFDNGFTASLAYTYGDSYAIFEGTSSQNSSQWRGVHAINGRNMAPMGRSDFAMGSRIIAIASKRFEYAKNFATTVSIFYTGQSGLNYSYIYNDNGALNNEDSRERNLIYVPANAGEINLVQDGDRSPEDQWADLDAFIEGDDYLSTIRGEYAEKNMNRTPFEHHFDFRLLQDIFIETGGNRHNLQVSLDILNVGNLLNPAWGWFYQNPGFGNYQLLNFEGFEEDPNTGEETVPTFTFDSQPENPFGIDNFLSRWRMQLGVRYIFN